MLIRWLCLVVNICSIIAEPTPIPVSVVQTAQNTPDRLTPKDHLPLGPNYAQQNIHYVINPGLKYQTIIGFGGAFTESSAYVLSQINATQQQKVFDMYFSSQGHKYTMGRTHIGSCDFSMEFYDYNNVSGDVSMQHFNLTSYDMERVIPFIKRAQDMIQTELNETLKLLITPWSPPGWMKTNGQVTCLIPLGDYCVLQEKFRDAMSLYLSKYIGALKGYGIPTWALTPQNEPESGKPTVETSMQTAAEEQAWISTSLGPRIKQDHPEVLLLAYDHNKDHVFNWAQTILGDPGSAPFTDGVAFHWYTGDQFENVEACTKAFPNKLFVASEATEERENSPDGYRNPTWEKGEHYAHDIIGDFNVGTHAWIDWNLVLDIRSGPSHADPTGEYCEGLIPCGSNSMVIIDTQTGEILPQAFYWYMGHLSRYVTPNSVRIGNVPSTAAASSGLDVFTALTPSGTTVVVVLNRNGTAAQVSFQVDDIGFNTTVPAHGIQTLWW